MDGIARFQKAHSLGIGRLGSEDWDYLVNDLINNNTQNNSQVSQTYTSFNAHLRDLQDAYNKDYGRSILVDGIRGQQVEQMLNEICLSVNDTHHNVVAWLQIRVGTSPDGIFGNNTKNAVINFQRSNGLTVDGIAGKNTFNKLLEIYK